jgi:hypothetical protein
MKNSMSRYAGILILVMWVASLILPVFSTCRAGYDHVGGWFMLMMGWMGVIVLQPAWFANLLMLVIAGLLLARGHAPVWLGVLTVIIAAPAWLFKEMTDDTGAVPICHYHAGYWLWFATAVVALLATFIPRPAQTAS